MASPKEAGKRDPLLIRHGRVLQVASVAIAILLTLTLTRALLASEPTPPGVRTLYPGDNLIGWVGYPTPAQELFEQIPEAELIFAWDAYESRYRFAAPGLQTSLDVVEPGMGLIVRISGTASVEWRQPIEANGERLTLERGPNLVAWTGPSGTPIDLALRSVGRWLSHAHYWNAEAQEFRSYLPHSRQNGEELPDLKRGDALWVFNKNGSSWLQPSGDRPLHSLNPPTDRIRWYRSFDKHLDAEGLAFIASASVADEALFRAAAILDEMLINRPDIRETLVRRRIHVAVVGRSEVTFDLAPYRHLRGQIEWPYGEGGPRGFGPNHRMPTLVPEENLLCLSDDSYRGYDVAVHELAHAVEYAISLSPDRGKFRSALLAAYRAERESGLWNPAYALRNPSEYWAEGVQVWLGVGGRSNNGFRHRGHLSQHAPQLAQLIRETLGDIDLHSTCHPVAAASAGATRKMMIRGSLTDSSGAALADARVHIAQPWGRVSDGGARTWPDGTFSLFASPDEYLIEFNFEGCSFYYADDGITTSREAASVVSLLDQDADIAIRLPAGFCDVQVNGRILDSKGRPQSGLPVALYRSAEVRTKSTSQEGTFEFRFPDVGPHYFRVSYGGCDYFFNGERLVGGHEQFQLLDYRPDVELELRLPERACTGEIRGNVVDEDGNPEARARIGPYSSWDLILLPVRRDGSFTIAVDKPGSHVLMISVNACIAYFGANGLTQDRTLATPLEVESQDLRNLEIVFPQKLCD